MTGRIRIASYNIHKGVGLDGRTSIARIVNVLREIDADVVALQEVVSYEGREAQYHQAQFLAAELDRHFSLGETRKHLGGAYGNVTLSKWAIANAKVIDVSIPGREPRGILRTDLDIGGRALHVFNTHLGTGFFERRRQAEKLIEQKLIDRGDLEGPRVVLGDFNEWTLGRVTTALREQFREAEPQRHLRAGYPGILPLLNLDHLYADRELRIEKVRLHRTRLSLLASDHLPLVADLTWDGTSSL